MPKAKETENTANTARQLVAEVEALRVRVAELEATMQEQHEEAARLQQALERVRSRIIAMRHLDELGGELENAWVEELRGLGIPINRASLQWPASAEGYFISRGANFMTGAALETVSFARCPWVQEAWESGKPVVVDRARLDQAGFGPEVQSLLEAPLPGEGSLGVNSLHRNAFGPEAVRTVQLFAGLITEGLQRLRDFEALGWAGQSLKIEVALQRVRNQILQMEREEDWGKVVVCFWEEMKELVEFDECSIDLVDLQQERFFLYQVGEGEMVQKGWIYALPRSLKQAMETGKPVYRRNREEMERCGDTLDTLISRCSVVDVPFSGGTFAINSTKEDAFSVRDIQVLERFAQVMSEAHRRLEELKELALQEEQLLQVQKLRAISQLATGVAHELNNPLTAVVGYSELLLHRELAPEVRQYVETIRQEGWRAHSIAERLLRFARRQQADRQWMPLNPLVREVLDLVRQQFELDHVQLSPVLAADLPMVQAHPGQLQQLLLALLQNSREAIQRSGKKEGQIEVQTQQQGDQVQLRVEDDGPGIPEKIRERIFEPFFTTTEVGEGTGMGLSMCYAIAREHGGRLWAEPRAAGACLVLELPARTDAAAASPTKEKH